MAYNMVIKIEGVDGESKISGHEDEIDVLSWSWGISQSGSFHSGGGGGSGKADIQDISFTKFVDKASTPLMLKCCKGEHIPEATLTVMKAGGDPIEYVVIVMTKLLVSSVSTGGSGGDDSLTENVTLNFAEVEAKYQPQDDEGAADGGTIDMAWSCETNAEP